MTAIAAWTDRSIAGEPTRRQTSHQAALVIGDAALLILVALLVAVRVEPGAVATSSWGLWDEASVPFIAGCIVPVHLTALVLSRSYTRRLIGTRDELSRAFVGSLGAIGFLAVLAYLSETVVPRGLPGWFFGLSVAGVLAWRLGSGLIVRVMRSRGAFVEDTVVVGTAGEVAAVINVLRSEAWAGYRVVGVVLTDDLDDFDEPAVLGVPVIGSPMSLTRDLARAQVSTVILTSGGGPDGLGFQRLLWQLGETGVEVLVAPGFINLAGPRMHVKSVAGMPLMHLELPRFTGAQMALKRVVGSILASVGLVVLAPVLAAVAVAIKLGSSGPVIFRQTRVGLGGEEFSCWKFRTMVEGADDLVPVLHELDQGNGLNFKIHADPRVTRVGRVLRRYSLDELPQLVNVLRGDMALVGPRPPLPTEVARYNDALQRRLLVRPGMTGLWQVSGRSDLSLEESTRLDLYYVDNWSLLYDVEIVLRTIRAVVTGRGAY